LRRIFHAALAASLLPAAASADELAAKLCPILDEVVGSTGGFAPEGVQTQLVMAVSGAYDYDPDALAVVLDGADPATTETCPEARDAILSGTGKATRAEAMR
jgi:hypothetical protein